MEMVGKWIQYFNSNIGVSIKRLLRRWRTDFRAKLLSFGGDDETRNVILVA